MRPAVFIPVEQANRWLDQVRDKTGLSITQIAERANLSASTLTRPRRGQGHGIKIATLRRVANALQQPLPAEFLIHTRTSHEAMRSRFQQWALYLDRYADPKQTHSPAERSAFIDAAMAVFDEIVRAVERGDLVPATRREFPVSEPAPSRRRARSGDG